MQATEFPAILVDFYQPNSTYIGVVGSHEIVDYSYAQQFSRWNGLD